MCYVFNETLTNVHLGEELQGDEDSGSMLCEEWLKYLSMFDLKKTE